MTSTETMTKSNYYLRALAVLVGLALAMSSLAEQARPAKAAFPGANGKVAFESNRDGTGEIYSMDPDGSKQTNLTKNPANDYESAVSPDGKKIVFASRRDGNAEIYKMNAKDGSSQKRLTRNAAFEGDPAFSPNGKKILFESYRDGNYEVYIMNAKDGSKQKNLTNNAANDALPDWGVSP
jgi:tricorn protease-like protein